MVVSPSAFSAGAPNTAATPGRWMGVGVSGAADAGPGAAAAHAAGQALAGRDAALLVVSGDAGQDPAELAAGVGAVAPGTPMIGGNVGGELCRGGSSTGRVLVVAFGGDGFTAATGCGQASAAGPAEAAEQAAGCLARLEDRPHQVLLMLSDATIGDQQEVLRGAYRTAGAGVPLVGGVCPIPARCRVRVAAARRAGGAGHGRRGSAGFDRPIRDRGRSWLATGRGTDAGDGQLWQRGPRAGRSACSGTVSAASAGPEAGVVVVSCW